MNRAHITHKQFLLITKSVWSDRRKMIFIRFYSETKKSVPSFVHQPKCPKNLSILKDSFMTKIDFQISAATVIPVKYSFFNHQSRWTPRDLSCWPNGLWCIKICTFEEPLNMPWFSSNLSSRFVFPNGIKRWPGSNDLRTFYFYPTFWTTLMYTNT